MTLYYVSDTTTELDLTEEQKETREYKSIMKEKQQQIIQKKNQ